MLRQVYRQIPHIYTHTHIYTHKHTHTDTHTFWCIWPRTYKITHILTHTHTRTRADDSFYSRCVGDFRYMGANRQTDRQTDRHTHDTLQHTATHCNAVQHTATHCNTCHSKYVGIFALGSVQTHHCCPARSDCDKLRNTMQHNETHTAKHCNTLQHMSQPVRGHFSASEQTHNCCQREATAANCATYCNTLQHTATHCNTLQHMSQQVCGQFLVHEGRQSIDT